MTDWGGGDASVGIATTPRPGRSGVRIPVGASDFYILLKAQTGCEAHSASYPIGTGMLCRE